MMRYLFSPASRPVLAQVAQQRTLCAFDFDGTLSPIVENPHLAGIREQTRILLRQLTALYPCVILSGRARADLLGRLAGIRVERAIGNHGAENEATPPKSMMVAEWKASIIANSVRFPGSGWRIRGSPSRCTIARVPISPASGGGSWQQREACLTLALLAASRWST